MSWVLATTTAWVLLSCVAGVVIGRGIRLAERMAAQAVAGPDAPDVVEPTVITAWTRPASAPRRATGLSVPHGRATVVHR
jgi:hypothetical protein